MKTGLIVAMASELEALRRAGISGAVQSGIGKAAAAYRYYCSVLRCNLEFTQNLGQTR